LWENVLYKCGYHYTAFYFYVKGRIKRVIISKFKQNYMLFKTLKMGLVEKFLPGFKNVPFDKINQR